jgi:hypothetical protein
MPSAAIAGIEATTPILADALVAVDRDHQGVEDAMKLLARRHQIAVIWRCRRAERVNDFGTPCVMRLAFEAHVF